MTVEKRTDFLNTLEDFARTQGFEVMGYEDNTDEGGFLKIVFNEIEKCPQGNVNDVLYKILNEVQEASSFMVINSHGTTLPYINPQSVAHIIKKHMKGVEHDG